MKNINCILLLFWTSTLICQAQSDEIIVQLEGSATIDQLKTSITVKANRQISKNMNIWLIQIPSNQKKKIVLSNFKNHPLIKAVEFNEKVTLRNSPNDIWFEDQWQYNNKGDGYGITDVDIDALKAWQQTTGGSTANGDEIVVAIIDGGIDLNHPDLINNLWINSHEIPNNNIDDDANGYIDDIYGWNFNDTIADVGDAGYGHWHGTPVAGIIGAEGNNYEGVCGVNWQVKIMSLVANQNVADVIAAYDYILEMRKRYNQTDGTEGAFVVATNASLGISQGKPSDHPLWCAMYNALGEEGILSVAATANNYIDVDLRGDLPTTCGSNFLVSVTNTNNRDELDFAAFGKRHIDLSAPGSDVFTAINDGYYGTFGGTSAAAPHVAGTIALLYATPNPLFMQAVQNDASATALLVKDFILNGTDPIADLYHKSVSNGRLNLFNSLCEMNDYFEGEGCIDAKQVKLQFEKITFNNARRALYVQFNMLGKSSLKVRLFNIAGQLHFQQQIPNINTGKHQLQFNFELLETGMYYLYINTDNTVLSKALIVP